MILDAFRLDNRVALVTGAARGLGQALAIGLAEAGADVVALDRLPVDETRERVEAIGRRSSGQQQDLRDLNAEGAATIIAKCASGMGHLDILVNNAGVIQRAPALEATEEEWSSVLDINLTAAFLLSQALARHLVEVGREGKIVNVASVLSFQGGILVPGYTAAKSGLAGLTRGLANEWARLGINVNGIAPGYLTTDLTAGIRSDPARHDTVLARIPAGRWGQPADAQGAVVFLASEAAAYLHGTIIPIDGGWLAW